MSPHLSIARWERGAQLVDCVADTHACPQVVNWFVTGAGCWHRALCERLGEQMRRAQSQADDPSFDASLVDGRRCHGRHMCQPTSSPEMAAGPD